MACRSDSDMCQKRKCAAEGETFCRMVDLTKLFLMSRVLPEDYDTRKHV